MANLGRVAFIPRGAYDANTTYEKYDVISYNNGSYVYINSISGFGHPPPNSTYWSVMLDPTALNAAVASVRDHDIINALIFGG